ncbi:DUF5916 domain-containing protein [Mangrovibacterium lignilyticum]|uniref:DUF5916 domain-containing protein n=1 Tax=Mangrovibacterium lignilyticum TaxID=2668052 RepID=UPI0013D109F3|nr:DUF5916 domain-containing protein [Mangrovibacterium lignilyticum]
MKQLIQCVTFLFLLFGYFLSPGQEQAIAKKSYQTASTDSPPRIDALLNDSCWNQVEWGGDFIQSQPYENKPPSQQTAFKILYDDNNLYVFIRAYDTEPDKISRRISRRDNFDGDMVEINIDSYYDQQTAFSFTAMASGAKGEEAVTKDGNNWDSSWNPVWYLKTSIDDEGWCAEMRIPFSQLRFGTKDVHVWGIQVMRHIFRLEERSTWQMIPKGSPGMVHLFGELHGIKGIKPKRQIELLPYTLAKIERFQKDEDDPFLDGKKSSFTAGLDGKAAITNDLTLDFTINPDFGQVEADPSEVNLSAFESYFSERRPFFVEGKNIYQFQPSNTIVIHNMGADNLFYSRRIGRFPHYSPDLNDNEYADLPEATTILGAMKLSGKTKNGLSIGILESLTANEKATIDYNGARRKESVEPLTNYFVGRVQQDFKKGETTLGGIVTAVNRDIDNPTMDFLPTAAYTGGLDFSHSWNERTWYVKGNVEFSHVKGDEEAMLELQQSSARYYQRPDADYVSVDSTRTSLSGYGGTVRFGRTSKKRIQFETSFTVRSPGLEFNDIGYMRYSDIIHHGSWVAYYLREPFAIFRDFYLNTNYWMYWNFSGKRLATFANTNFNTQFKNKWRLNGNFTWVSENISTSLLRGGPSFTVPGSSEMNLNISTDHSKKLAFYLGSYLGLGDVNSYRYREYWAGIEARPTNALSVSFEPSYGIGNNKMQYVETTDMNDDPRYLFATLDQKTAIFTFRLNYTFSPELSLEYYGQPFISAGKYSEYKRTTNTNADRFADRYRIYQSEKISYNAEENSYAFDENGDGSSDYTVDNPDFNFRQFRSNFVVRWEYKPGSTLFLVWSQGRTGSVSDGSFDYGRDMRELFQIEPHNVFLVKFSYWFSL